MAVACFQDDYGVGEGAVGLLSIKKSYIRMIGYGLLLINVLIFLGTWCRLYIGIPAICLLLYGFYILGRNILADDAEIIISQKALWLVIGLMTAWVVFSGLGGFFPQKFDLHWRNAILHDLINYPWPVVYSDGSSLTYYIAFWLAPALLGKLGVLLFSQEAGWIIANFTYALYSASLLCVMFLLITSYLKVTTTRKILVVGTVLILFSGMDIVPIVIRQMGQSIISIGTHLEWWTNIQYSSNATQLAWVYNQAVPAWLVTSLFLHERHMSHWAFLGLLLLPYGPFPLVGLAFLMVITALDELTIAVRKSTIKDLIREILTIPNLTAATVIVPIYYLYYFTNTATSAYGIRVQVSDSYFYFILVEFLVFALLIGKVFFKERLFIFDVICLIFIPFIALGAKQDFCMRASIPFLFILMIYVMRYLFEKVVLINNRLQMSGIAFVLLFCLGVGAITPLTEFRASYVKMVQTEGGIMMADDIRTLGHVDMERANFVTMNASNTLFYQYLAPDSGSCLIN